MSVLIEKSVCVDCKGKDTCQRLKRLTPGKTIRDNLNNVFDGVDIGTLSGAKLYIRPNRKEEVFEVIITNCSMKLQYNIRKMKGELTEKQKEENFTYYCNLCKTMHRLGSTIGKAHKPISDKILVEIINIKT